MQAGSRGQKGKVGIEARGNDIRFNLPRSWFPERKDQIRFALGLPNTEENWKEAESIASQMERDFLLKALPESIEGIKAKYLPKSHLTVVETIAPKMEPSLDEVWNAFLDHLRVLEEKGKMSPNTLANQYRTFTNYIKGTTSKKGDEIKLPTLDLSKAGEIRDYCERVIPADSCKRFIYRLGKACRWAQENGMISSNPFDGMAPKITVPKKSNEDTDINPFTKEEREAILEALKTDRFCSKYARVKHSHYYNWVFFLFKTGCRSGESVVLRWKDMSDDFRYITFSRNIALSEKKGRVEKSGLKTQKKRRFGVCSQELQSFLRSIKPEDCDPDSLVFPPPLGGKWINYNNFSNRVWLGEKGEKGLLECLEIPYRKFYQTRHTFITLMLHNGASINDVARLVGNTPEVIYKHYASNKHEIHMEDI
ncbi:integrase family protein [Leptolyngbya sp. NIES-3755]|nr:integrase family protein [Leptolyngbya sp. NIES-3755]